MTHRRTVVRYGEVQSGYQDRRLNVRFWPKADIQPTNEVLIGGDFICFWAICWRGRSSIYLKLIEREEEA